MITLDVLAVTIDGLDKAEVEHWIREDWVRPTSGEGTWLFCEIDVARLRLIQQLRYEFEFQEDVMPVVLRLLDQLYDERRRLRLLRDAVEQCAPPQIREAVLQALRSSDNP